MYIINIIIVALYPAQYNIIPTILIEAAWMWLYTVIRD